MDGHSPDSLDQQNSAAPRPVAGSLPKRFAFICNDRAGSGPGGDAFKRAALEQIVQELSDSGYETRKFPCRQSPEATAWDAIRSGYDVIVAVGGDGTVSGCAAAVWKNGGSTLLGVIPAGTLNHFSKDLGIPNLASARDALAGGHVRDVDIATVNGLPFVNNSGIGLYPVIVRKREFNRRAGIPRWIAFAFATCRVLSRLPLRRLRLETDGNRLAQRTPFLFVGNNTYRVQGLGLGTRARLDGGTLGIYASCAPGRFALIRMAFRALFGTLPQDRNFISLEAQNLTVRSRHSSMQISLDGELRRLRIPLEYRSIPAALRVIAPPVK